MQITISDKAIAIAVGHMLDGSVYEYFSTEAQKAAGVPKRSELIQAVIADPKFQAQFVKQIAHAAEDYDMLVDFAYESNCKLLNDLVKACDRADNKIAYEASVQKQKQEIKRMIALLEEEGYTVAKKPQK